jgi:hypothetical protein
VLQTYGDASVLPDLEKALHSRWRQNAAIALSELPEGLGIPVLMQFAQDPSIAAQGNGDVVLRPLAQVAVKYPEAFSVLLEQARAGQVRDSAWPTIASAIAGHEAISNGNLLAQDGNASPLSAGTAEQRLALMDQLLRGTQNNAAIAALSEQLRVLATSLQR